MIGDGNSRLFQLGDAIHQLFNPAGAVKKAVFGMHMKVYKIFHLRIPSLLFCNFKNAFQPVVKPRL
jgi:hypothetical protein